MKILNKKQSGFTLVELVVVVAVVGVLAVIAAPKIVGVADDARNASLIAVTGMMTAASARNYAAREASADGITTFAIDHCTDINILLDGDVLPNGYNQNTSNDTSIDVGKQVGCYISTESNPVKHHIFYGIGTD